MCKLKVGIALLAVAVLLIALAVDAVGIAAFLGVLAGMLLTFGYALVYMAGRERRQAEVEVIDYASEVTHYAG